CTGHGSIFAYW
nr:immunoglobulin heavy chain junction region [Mus musculus]MBK4195818.1 immunoglobulin heavy chain junction region [Mus musculus]